VAGHAVRDAEDLYRVMEMVWDRLQQKIEVTDFYVTGYSLGGFNTAFVTWLDERRKVFNFRKALLINPPVRLYSSISLLDRMLENIPGGVDNFAQYYNRIVTEFSEVYKRADRLEFNEDFLYQVYEQLKPKDEELAALIGLSFRFSSAHLAFTSDLMTDFGYVKPSNVHLTRNSSPGDYIKVVYRLGFTDYFHEFFYPYYHDREGGISRENLIEEMSLTSIEDYLRGADKIEVMHNANDLILEPGEIDFFPRVFGSRAKIYPKGGHCGNMEYRDNVAQMVNVFRQ
jgi:pimeloyl-ACP methyl ester carboxylesterase